MLLKVGSIGEDVKKLQQFLGLNADGSFGPMTEFKVKEFQTKNGLTADGIVGPATLEKMGITSSPVIKEEVIIPTGGPIDLSKLKGHIPENVISQIPTVMEKFGINTPLPKAGSADFILVAVAMPWVKSACIPAGRFQSKANA